MQDRPRRSHSQAVHPGINAGGVVVAGGEEVGWDPDINIRAQLLQECIRRRADRSIDYQFYYTESRSIRAEQHRAAWRWLVTTAKAAVTRCKAGFATVFAFGKGPARPVAGTWTGSGATGKR